MIRGKKYDLTQRIEEVLKNKATTIENAYTKSLEELIEDLNIYQYELEFQKDELQKTQLQLEESKNEYVDLFENAPVGYVIIDENTRLLDCNQTFKNMLDGMDHCGGYRKRMDFRKLIFAADQDRFHLFFAELINSKGTNETEIRLILPDNEMIYVQIMGRYSTSGTKQRVLLSIKDITIQQKAQEELRESKNQYESLVNNIPGITFRCNTDPAWTMLFVSANVETISGYKADDLLFNRRISLMQIIHEQDREKVVRAVTLGIKKKETWAIEYRLWNKNGTIRWVYEKGCGVYDEKGQAIFRDSFILDITEEKNTEDQLHGFFNVNLDLLCIADLEGNFHKINKEWENVLGYSEQELINRNYLEFIHPDDVKPTLAIMADLGKNKKILNFVNRYRTRDGSYRFIEWRSHPSGNLVYAAARDITERKQAEEALRQSEERFRNIMASMHDIVYTLDNEQRHTGVYGPWVQQQGLTPAHFSGKTSREILGAKAASPHEKANKKALKGEFVVYEWSVETQNGTMYFQTSLSPIINARGEIKGLVGIGRNISELKQTERELKESEERFRALHNASFGGIAIHDKGIILECNQGLSEMTGYTMDELMGMNGLLLIAPQDRDMVMDKILSGFVKPYEANGLRKNGEQFPIQLEARNVPYKGKMVRTTEFRDITLSKQVDEVCKQLEIATKTVQFKQNFLANMSHEIRTPLTGMLGMTEILEQTPLDEHQKDYLNTLKTSGRHLNEIINQVLDFSKLEAGKFKLKPVNFQISELFNDCIELCRSQIKPEVQIIKHIDPQIPACLTADRLRLAQVLNNLLSNAVKFTSRGSITLRSHLVSFSSTQDECVIKMEVIDTGPGICEAMQKKLFTPFFQIEMKDTRDHEGTGLGLAISKEIIGLIGGQLGLTSETRKGSTFWFTFPAKIAHKPVVCVEKKRITLSAKNVTFSWSKIK
jgi:PAS domain S-box-containing protein